MPTYEYVCTDCGNNLEVVQRFTDESLTECPVCHGRLRKMFYPVGVVFKGSGFYRTDSRTQDKERAAAGSTNGSPGTKADDAAKTVEKTGTGDGAKTGAGRKGEPGSKKAASTPAA
ncbi:MAG TPA: FmdB family zinc ribbon protein [Jiangellaceae bacterium]|nr:FmdB family zinc ribbon protein [Jiangellaceae bacterium]